MRCAGRFEDGRWDFGWPRFTVVLCPFCCRGGRISEKGERVHVTITDRSTYLPIHLITAKYTKTFNAVTADVVFPDFYLYRLLLLH
jgi:hypothetical protein